MFARQIITEGADQRSKVQKLLDLIKHPNTEATVRAVALEKLKILGVDPTIDGSLHEIPKQEFVFSAHTNLVPSDMERPYLGRLKCGEIYNALLSLSPAPTTIHFLRQGVVHMFVPPPYNGLTKQQYVSLIRQAVPAIRVSDTFINDPNKTGYMFTLYFV